MPIQKMYQVGADSDYKAIGFALSQLSHNHVVNFDGQTGLSFSYNNCNAAVAVQREGAIVAGYQDLPEALAIGGLIGPSFVAVYGCSRLYAGLDTTANAAFNITSFSCNPFSSSKKEEHAEQTAILLVDHLGLTFWAAPDGTHHIYIDFTPCQDCGPWLDEREEDWIVHYGVELTDKNAFAKGRKSRLQARAAQWKQARTGWTGAAKAGRRSEAIQNAKAKRLEAANKRRGLG